MTSYFCYWGKASKDNPDEYHLLPYHCLDVAAVASVWWDQSINIRRAFCWNTSFSENQTKSWVLFFVALHDYGKFDIRFQAKSLETLKLLQTELDFENFEPDKKYDHGTK